MCAALSHRALPKVFKVCCEAQQLILAAGQTALQRLGLGCSTCNPAKGKCACTQAQRSGAGYKNLGQLLVLPSTPTGLAMHQDGGKHAAYTCCTCLCLCPPLQVSTSHQLQQQHKRAADCTLDTKPLSPATTHLLLVQAGHASHTFRPPAQLAAQPATAFSIRHNSIQCYTSNHKPKGMCEGLCQCESTHDTIGRLTGAV